MPNGPQGQKRPAEVIGNAVLVANTATGPLEDSAHRQPTKAKLGHAGAKARVEKLTPDEREEIAKIAAQTRWGIKE